MKGLNIMNSLNIVLVFIVLMSLGFFTNKFKLVDSNFINSLSSFVFKIIFPAMVINSMISDSSKVSVSTLILLVAIATVSIIFMYFIGNFMNFIFKNKGDKARILRFGLMYPNYAFMAYPVMEILFGHAGLFYIAIFTIPVRILYFSLSGLLLKGPSSDDDSKDSKPALLANIKTALLNPAVIAVPVGLILYYFKIPLPEFISQTIKYLAATATPLGMIILGLALPQKGFIKAFSDKKILIQSFFRLFIAPALGLLFFSFVHVDPLIRNVSIIYLALPMVSSSVILSINYKSDWKTCAKAVLVSTILSVVTLPIWIWVIGTL